MGEATKVSTLGILAGCYFDAKPIDMTTTEINQLPVIIRDHDRVAVFGRPERPRRGRPRKCR